MTDFLTKLKALSHRRRGKPTLPRFVSMSDPSGNSANTQTGNTQTGNTQNGNTQNGNNGGKRNQFSMAGKLDGSRTKNRSQQTADALNHAPRRALKQFKRLQRSLYRRWWAWGLAGIGFGVGGAAIALHSTLVSIERELPDTVDALSYVRTGTLTIKAADGEILQQTGPATRDKVSLAAMPEQLPEAFISSEDEDFYRHGGVDYQAIARAFLKNVTAGEVVEGGSTITQQLARIVFLDQERSLARKIKEALLAQKMERELDKDQILERYLNLVYLGSSAYGVADAAWIYFSKDINELTLSEMAMIAGMAPAPSVYSPLINPDLAKQRRDTVLQRMEVAGYITAAERDVAIAEPLEVNPSEPKNLYSEVPYFTSYIQQQLPQYVSPEELELGGLTVETTLNLDWQQEAQATVDYAIENYGPYEGFEQAALVAIDPRTGEIRALVGGDDFEKSQFNRATQAQRQPGSTFKAFVYSAAIAAGFSPYTTYVDAKLVVDGYEPQNYGRSYRGSVSIRDALVSSINIVAVKTLIDVGFDPVIDIAHKMGIKSDLLPAYSLALGSSEVNLLELTSAYGTLANEGNYVEVHGITRIFDRFGKVIYEADFQPKRAIDEGSAAVMTWMLQGVVDNGTGWEARLPDRTVAGKTGTSEKRRDLWFVGYIPQLVTGVWLGNDDSSPTYGASSTAARTWYDFMNTLIDDVPVEEFPETPPLVEWEGSIEAKPVKPSRIYEASSPSGGSSSDDWGYSDDGYYDDGYYDDSYDSGYSEPSWEPASAPEPSYDQEESSYTESEPDIAPADSAPVEPAAEPVETAPPPPILDEAPAEPAAVEAPPPPILEELPPPVSEPPPIAAPAESAPASNSP